MKFRTLQGNDNDSHGQNVPIFVDLQKLIQESPTWLTRLLLRRERAEICRVNARSATAA